jgi:fructose-1,6-bisphosphatase/inositol monophosphatase family enzyme
MITAEILKAFPYDGLLGEEGSDKPSTSGRKWIIDPIDGTRDFIRGNPVWSNLIALEVDGEIVVGVCNLVAQKQTYYAHKGHGVWRNGEPIRISNVADKNQAVALINGFHHIAKRPFAPRLLDWLSGFWGVRSMGGCMDAMMVASGKAELYFENNAAPWDMAPLKLIVEEAGGRFFNTDGGSSIYGGDCIACVPALADMALEFFRA